MIKWAKLNCECIRLYAFLPSVLPPSHLMAFFSTNVKLWKIKVRNWGNWCSQWDASSLGQKYFIDERQTKQSFAKLGQTFLPIFSIQTFNHKLCKTFFAIQCFVNVLHVVVLTWNLKNQKQKLIPSKLLLQQKTKLKPLNITIAN